ncbi:MAG: ABC transporter ATP-binding protein [Actinomycetaceae bacterium]|nr:ABC transporter ATP-binding protein [Actinomycetaceae bacterium]
MLYLDNVSKSFGKKTVLHNINAEFPERACSIIVGVNGSGKTTLLNIIAGLSSSSSGIISLNEYCEGSNEYKKRVFYIPSDFYLPDFMTGREYARFVFSRYPRVDKERFSDIASAFDIDNALDMLISSYSFGMKKKIQIAIASCLDVDVLLIDEGLTGLDFETTLLVQHLFSLLVRRMAIVLVTHDMDTVRCFPDSVFLLRNGRLESFSGHVNEIPKYVSMDGSYEEKIKLLEKCNYSS